jgi:hypothetical protein
LKNRKKTYDLILLWVGRLGKLLLILASTVIVTGSESRLTHDHIFLSQDPVSSAVPFPSVSVSVSFSVYIILGQTAEKKIFL